MTTYIRRLIISGSDVNKATTELNSKANWRLSASFYSSSVHPSPDLIYYDVEFYDDTCFPSIMKNISEEVTYCECGPYIRTP